MTSRKVVIEIGDSIGSQEKAVKAPAAAPPILLFNFNISKLSVLTQFMLMTFAVFFCYVLYGLVLEKIFLIPRLKKAGLYLTFVQFILYSKHTLKKLYPIASINQVVHCTILGHQINVFNKMNITFLQKHNSLDLKY